jgi:hypothetical protein
MQSGALSAYAAHGNAVQATSIMPNAKNACTKLLITDFSSL